MKRDTMLENSILIKIHVSSKMSRLESVKQMQKRENIVQFIFDGYMLQRIQTLTSMFYDVELEESNTVFCRSCTSTFVVSMRPLQVQPQLFSLYCRFFLEAMTLKLYLSMTINSEVHSRQHLPSA